MTHILPPTGAPLPLPPLSSDSSANNAILSSDEDGFKKFYSSNFIIVASYTFNAHLMVLSIWSLFKCVFCQLQLFSFL